jgi:hypothetical protein
MYCATGTIPPDALPDSSLQFFSIKVTDLSGLSWPLQVHGFVAARDSVDRRRNYLLRCSRDNCQTLTEKVSHCDYLQSNSWCIYLCAACLLVLLDLQFNSPCGYSVSCFSFLNFLQLLL